ncbi:bifunctional methylenetetrahydrofolate dehydrogenase/cyclohydrolase 2, mitochondrial isoform X3 [Pseudorca crassidens]|uniref:bifunctional methylenetetrahydrofolate dehydrogenase/cyclohydrolase 2, mitochondrial isoform X3 n=1 Tax=Pseudorca crassidens TaxID=82174 RepID=UPI00352DEF16
MTVSARAFWLLRGRLGRVSALGRSAASLLAAPGTAGRAFRGFRSSGLRHDAIIISGTEMAKQIQKEIQRGVESWISLGNGRPHLSIILVGDNPASHTYVRKKIKAAAAVDHVDERTVCNGIAPEKDVDGFHIINIGRLCLDQHSLIPATASAVWEIIKRTGIETFGKNVVVAGRSKNAGMPIAMLLHTDGEHERPGGDATVTIAHRYTPKEQLKIHTLLADVIVVAAVVFTPLTLSGSLFHLHNLPVIFIVREIQKDAAQVVVHLEKCFGIPKLITSDMVKEGAAVIDVGINYVHDPMTGKTKLVGDVDFEAVKKKASFITPVPGGVGPMTVAMLLKNTLLAAKKIIY